MAPVVDIVGVVVDDHPASGFISCAYVGVDPTASYDHAANTDGTGAGDPVGEGVFDPDDVPLTVCAGVAEEDPVLDDVPVLTGLAVSDIIWVPVADCSVAVEEGDAVAVDETVGSGVGVDEPDGGK